MSARSVANGEARVKLPVGIYVFYVGTNGLVAGLIAIWPREVRSLLPTPPWGYDVTVCISDF